MAPFNWFGTKEASVVVTDMDGNGLSVTGGPYYLSIDYATPIEISPLCYTTQIPNDTPPGAIVGFIEASDPDPDDACHISDSNSSFGNIDPDGSEHYGNRTSENYLQAEGLQRGLNMAHPIIFYSGLDSQPNTPANVQITDTIKDCTTASAGAANCCGASGELTDIRTTVSIPYDTFLTGVGPDVLYWRRGNVEETYIQFANSSQNKLAIFPASSGGGSQDEYFYIYNVGQTGLSGVAPPSSGLQIQNAICYTGISTNPRILIHYNDTGNNNIFYNYSVTGDSLQKLL